MIEIETFSLWIVSRTKALVPARDESTEINWISKGLDGEDCRVIASLIGKGAMHQVTHLELRNNSIGDPGLRYLSEALANGGMTKLQWLDLSENFVGDLELFSVCYPPVGIMVYK
jgi:hypothetical protein